MKFRLFTFTGLLLMLSIQLLAYNYQRLDSTVTSTYKIIHLQEKSVPWDIFVMEIDLSQDGIRLKTGLANNKVAYMDGQGTNSAQKETLGAMINRRTTAGEKIIAGINADFFDMTQGWQFNVTATDGRIASTGITSTHHSALYTDENGVPYINLINMNQTMSIRGAGDRAINSVNNIRRENHLVIYNSYTGKTSSFANEWGTEILLEPLEEIYLNGQHKYKVIKKAAKVSMTSDQQIIASGHGTAVEFLNKAVAGDTIQISTSFAGIGNEKIYEMIGGWGHIVKKGINTAVSSIVEEGTMQHENQRHPRSAAGYNQDKTKLYLVAVDGRSTLSKGMNLNELSNFMIDGLSVWDGLNFDGGGSTTLNAGKQTINTVSEGTQRAIANALLVIKQNPAGTERIQNKKGISLYPNPAKEFITIELEKIDADNLFFEIYHLDGIMVSKKALYGTQQNNTRHQIDIKSLQPGTYLYSIGTTGNTVSSGKFVVQ